MAPAALIGEVVAVTITRAGANSLFGELAPPLPRDVAPELAGAFSGEVCSGSP
jgi:hypothetical protein